MENKIKIYVEYFKNGYELAKANISTISYVAYGIGLIIQIVILSLIAGLYGMSYISFQFSLVLFVMIAFLLILSIPTAILFIIFLFFTSFLQVWNGGLFWKILTAIYVILLACIPLIKAWIKEKKPGIFERIRSSKISNTIEVYYLRWGVLVFIAIISMFLYFTFFPQIAKVNTSNYWNILGKYLFYNQNYYFLEVCWERLILPSSEVNGISIALTRSEINDPTKQEKMAELNKKYLDFCNNDFLKKF